MQDNQRQTHEWSYMAGIMDADGCFMISKHNRQTRNRISERAKAFPKKVDKWSFTYLPCAKIGMAEVEAIDLIMNQMNFGKMSIDGARKNRPHSKPIFHWRIREKNELVMFLEGVIPYLRIKKNRAQHLLDYCKHLQIFPRTSYYGLPSEELDYREDMYIKMRKFNGNEVAATTKFPGHESACDSLISKEI